MPVWFCEWLTASKPTIVVFVDVTRKWHVYRRATNIFNMFLPLSMKCVCTTRSGHLKWFFIWKIDANDDDGHEIIIKLKFPDSKAIILKWQNRKKRETKRKMNWRKNGKTVSILLHQRIFIPLFKYLSIRFQFGSSRKTEKWRRRRKKSFRDFPILSLCVSSFRVCFSESWICVAVIWWWIRFDCFCASADDKMTQ